MQKRGSEIRENTNTTSLRGLAGKQGELSLSPRPKEEMGLNEEDMSDSSLGPYGLDQGLRE